MKKKGENMKKIAVVFAVLAAVSLCFAGGSANTFVSGNASWGVPSNIAVYTLDSNYVTDDTLGATYFNYYRPYALSSATGTKGTPQYKGFRALCPLSSIGATCTVGVAYQVISGATWADTAKTGWQQFDTVAAAAGTKGTYVRLDTLPGRAIAFRLQGINGTSIFAKKLKVFLIGTATESVDTKH